jgi:DNA-binding GntR family transcriptional regulator
MTEQTEHLDSDFDVAPESHSHRPSGAVELDGEIQPRNGRDRHATSPSQKWSANLTAERTLAERAYAAIYGAIMDGTFAPGERLRIEDLSASLHISPTPIREALNRLEAAGLAEHEPHRGSRVSLVSTDEFRELYELRFILEPLAAAKAAENFTAEDADSARYHLDRLRAALQANEIPAAWEAHTAFHFTLYRAAKSRWLERLIIPLWDSCRRYRFQQSNLLAQPVQNRAEHEKILNACVEHDAATASLELYNHTARNANVIAMATYGEEFFQLKE